MSENILRLEAAYDELKLKYDKLFEAVKTHHDQIADDLCIEDDNVLYEAAGLPPRDNHVGDPLEMVSNCIRFIKNRCQGGKWESYKELMEAYKKTRAALGYTLLMREFSDEWHHTNNENVIYFRKIRDEALTIEIPIIK